MSKLPFKNTTKFPLNGITFGSRVQTHIDSNKNYILLGFKPLVSQSNIIETKIAKFP